MKKVVLMLGALVLSASAMAHTQYLYTENLDVSGQKEVKMKTIFGHPAEGNEAGGVSVSTHEGKAMPIKEFFMVHNGEKVDLTAKVKEGSLKTDKNTVRTMDYTFTAADGFKGQGSFVFVMVPSKASDEGYTFHGHPKLIITKDGSGSDWDKRVAQGYPEIVPLKNPTNAWKEDVFVAKFVDKDGKAISHGRVDIDFINAKIDLEKNIYVGGNPDVEKSFMSTFTDDNGMFYFSAPKEGIYTIRAVASMDRDKKEVTDTSLVVVFK